MDSHDRLCGGNQVALVIGHDGDNVGPWREWETLRVRYRLSPHGPWAAGTRHSQRYPVNVPDDFAEAPRPDQ
jgi:hypothetical protein